MEILLEEYQLSDQAKGVLSLFEEITFNTSFTFSDLRKTFNVDSSLRLVIDELIQRHVIVRKPCGYMFTVAFLKKYKKRKKQKSIEQKEGCAVEGD